MRFLKHALRHYFEINLFVMAFVLPCSIDVATRYIYIFIALNLIYFLQNKERPFTPFLKSPGFYLPGLYFALCFISILPDVPQSLKVLEKFVIIAVFPILILLNGRKYLTENTRNVLFSGFITGNLVVALTNIFGAFNSSITINNGNLEFDSSVYGNTPFWWSLDHVGNYFFSIHFSDFIHPTYWSLYLTLCITVLILRNPFTSVTLLNRKRARVVLISFFLLIMGLAASRAGMIGLFVSLLLLTGVHMKRTKFAKRMILVAAIVLVAMATLIAVNPRMNSLISEIESGSYAQSARMASWVASISIIKQHWLNGVGLHNAEDALIQTYKALNFEENYGQEYNAHQQFLETFISMGIAGLAVLIGIFAAGIKIALERADVILGLFVINLLIHFMFESMLDRFHGIAIFALFYPLLLHNAALSDNRNR